MVRRNESTDDTPHVWTKENLFRGLHESLERMRTDYVDVMQLHNPSVEQCEDGGLVTALQEMKEQGKVRWIGVSTTHAPGDLYRLGVFDSFQIPYSALEREHEELIQAASDSGAGVIVRGGVARGEPGAGLGKKDRWASWEAAGLDDLLDEGETRMAFLLRFTNAHPGMNTNIVGTMNVDHLKENIAAASRPLPADTYAEAKTLGRCGDRSVSGS